MSTSTVPSQLTDAELRLLQALVYQECGMHFDERRAHFLQDRLQRRLKECQLDSFYSEPQMSSVDFSYRLRYFDKIGERYAVKRALKEVIHFDFHNLKTEYLPQRNDVIFCRNVMMYFDEAEQKRLIDKFWRCLNPDGYMFVGHAESLLGLTEKFAMVHRNSGTAYQKVEVIE